MNRFFGSQFPSRPRAMHLSLAAILGFLVLQSGCAHFTPMNAVVRVVIKECGTDREYYYAHQWSPRGADLVLFESQDDSSRVIEFYKPAGAKGRSWPFTGSAHKIHLSRSNPRATRMMDQFANQTASSDTFLFKITGPDELCGKGPSGPGIISDP